MQHRRLEAMNFGADFARLAFKTYFLNVLHVCADVYAMSLSILYIYTKFLCRHPCLCLCTCTCPCDMLCAMSIWHMHDIERMILHDMIDNMHVVHMHVSMR